MSVNLHVLTIDPQYDFCHPKGALYVPGADRDIVRAAKMMRRLIPAVTDWHVTLDSHQFNHIAHPQFVVDRHGKHPQPLTMITYAQAQAGEYTTAEPSLRGKWLAYIAALEQNGRYPYIIWPPHCRIGHPGATVMPELHEVLDEWATAHFATVDFVPKGSSPWTEHYSAIVADVEDPGDATTRVNMRLVRALEEADMLLVFGEASSHCVANTVADVVDNLGDPSFANRIFLATDCMSAVPTCEFLWDAFLAKYGSRINLTTSTEIVKQF